MIRGYPRVPSLFPGEQLVLHVSTDSPRFRVEIYRQGATLTRMGGLGAILDGYAVPDGPPDIDWGWPAYAFDIPHSWPTGAYIAMLIEIRPDGTEIIPDTTTTFATEAKALFILRYRGAVETGTILYKVSWATFAAYNGTGYGSLYSEAMWSSQDHRPGFKVTGVVPDVAPVGSSWLRIQRISMIRRRAGRRSSTGMRPSSPGWNGMAIIPATARIGIFRSIRRS